MKIPGPLQPLYNAWMKFSHVLGIIMSTLLLTILWLVGFGIYAILIKIGKLFQKKEKLKTYWIKSEAHSLEQMQRQF